MEMLGLLVSLFICSIAPVIAQPNIPCLDVSFGACQTRFNEALGFNLTWSWKNSAQIGDAVRNLMLRDINGLMDVCRVRTLFSQCLGAAYPSCINRLTLITKDGTAVHAAFEYVRLFQQLQFICNGGFETYVRRYDCLSAAYSRPDTQACISAFNSTFIGDPVQRCGAVTTFMACMQMAYTTACNSPTAGWFICEDLRVSHDCAGLRCPIQQNE